MSSGVKIHQDCIDAFQKQKIRKQHRYLLYKMDSTYENIILFKTSGPEETYEDFLNSIPETECFYATIDLPDPNGQTPKLIFLMFTPENAKVKDRMVFASSKDGFVKKLEGVHGKLLQASERSDLDYKLVADQYF